MESYDLCKEMILNPFRESFFLCFFYDTMKACGKGCCHEEIMSGLFFIMSELFWMYGF